MKVLTFLLLAAGATLGGCVNSPSALTARETYVRPGLIMLTSDQAARHGLVLEQRTPPPVEVERQKAPPTSTAASAQPPKAYLMGRTVDPSDRRLMHEAHLVYRRDTDTGWDAGASAAETKAVASSGLGEANTSAPLLNQELTAALIEQRKATLANEKAIAALFDAVQALTRQQQTLAKRQRTERPKQAETETAVTPTRSTSPSGPEPAEAAERD